MPELLNRKILAAHGTGHVPVDIENCAGWIAQQIAGAGVDGSHLLDQLAHVLGPGSGCRLVGHGRGPLHQIRAEQSAQRHQHQADRAVAANIILAPVSHGLVNHVAIDRVQHNHRILLHAQR